MNHDDLIQRFLDGHVSPAEAAELSRLIETDDDVRLRYLDLAELHAALTADETLRGPRVEAIPFTPAASRPRWVGAVWKVAAVLLIAGIGVWMLLSHRKAAPLLTPPIATLISTVNARWSDPSTELSLNAGEAPSGILRLMDGSAQFVTAKGASVILEAPAAMRFDGPTLIFVESGKVVCRCPTPASRLTVRTAQTRVVDLGTEFAVEVREDQSTRVAVRSGEVQLGPDSQTTVLRQGEAAEVRTRGVRLLRQEEVREMMRSFDEGSAMADGGLNRLKNGGFDRDGDGEWSLVTGNVQVVDGALRISSLGNRFWPSARQTIRSAGLPGRGVAASVRAMQPPDDPLRPQQFAVLKLVFIGTKDRDLAYASRHFQFGGEPVGEFQSAHVAAIAPAGTRGVRVEVLLNARGEDRGSVLFDDAVLMIGEPTPQPALSR